MTLKEQITSDLKKAMLNKEVVKRNVLRVVKAEISREEAGIKEFNDKDIQKVITKIINNLKEINNDISLKEIEILSAYIPDQLTKEEIEYAIKGIIVSTGSSSIKDIGRVMKKFNEDYSGKADGKVAGKIARELLA